MAGVNISYMCVWNVGVYYIAAAMHSVSLCLLLVPLLTTLLIG